MRGAEIVGIAGVAGNGQDELFGALSGERLADGDDAIVIDGRAAGRLSITQRRRLGAAFVPEERLGHATAPRMTLSDNALLTGHAVGMTHDGFIDRAAALKVVDAATQEIRHPHRQTRPGSRKPVRRQPAEIRGRP